MLFCTLFLLCGCGGGSTVGTLAPAQELTLKPKQIDISHATKAKLTKENALIYLSTAAQFLPQDPGITKYQYSEILKQRKRESTRCSNGGAVTISSIPSENRVSFTFDNCRENNDIALSGHIDILFEDIDKPSYKAHFYATDFTFSYGAQSLLYNYTIDLSVADSTRAEWDYYVDMKDVRTDERLRYNLHIKTTSDATQLSSKYLFPDNTWLALSSSQAPRVSMPLFGVTGDDFFDQLLRPDYESVPEIILEGDNSALEARILPQTQEHLYALTTDREEDKTFFLSDSKQIWTDKLEDIVPNTSTATLSVSSDYRVLSEEYDRDLFYLSFEKESKLRLNINDYDKIGDYHAEAELLEKPADSRLKKEKRKIMLENPSGTNPSDSIRKSALFRIMLDAEGIYLFNITIHDGEKEVHKKVYIEYYKGAKLPKTFHKLSYDAIDTLYLPDLQRMLFLRVSEGPQLIIDDLNGNIRKVDLPRLPTAMSLDADHRNLYITADAKIYRVDLTDIDNPKITKTYDVPARLGKIVIFRNHAYIIEDVHDWNRFFVIDLESGKYTEEKYPFFSSRTLIILNRSLHSLYIDDSSITHWNVEKYNILSDGTLMPMEAQNTADIRDNSLYGDIWNMNDKKLLDAYGNMLTMSNDKNRDLHYAGTIDTLAGNSDIYDQNDEVITAFAPSPDKKRYLIIKIPQAEKWNTDSIFNKLALKTDTLELHAFGDDTLLKRYTLRKFYKNEKGEIVRIFPKKAYYISENRIFILYEAVSEKHAVPDLGNKRYLYEIREL